MKWLRLALDYGIKFTAMNTFDSAPLGLPEVEILLASGAFGTADPRDPMALAQASHSGTGAYGRALKLLAAEQHCAYLDLTTTWAEYLRSAQVHPHRFYRDPVHANEYGEQVLAKILMAFWTAPPPQRPRVATSCPAGIPSRTGAWTLETNPKS